MTDLQIALNNAGWDGRWFRRAYMDDGKILGSIENEECRIDSIAQSWAVISNAGNEDKQLISMESLENHLVDRENGIIKHTYEYKIDLCCSSLSSSNNNRLFV